MTIKVSKKINCTEYMVVEISIINAKVKNINVHQFVTISKYYIAENLLQGRFFSGFCDQTPASNVSFKISFCECVKISADDKMRKLSTLSLSCTRSSNSMDHQPTLPTLL